MYSRYVVLTSTHRYNAVRGHRTGSNKQLWSRRLPQEEKQSETEATTHNNQLLGSRKIDGQERRAVTGSAACCQLYVRAAIYCPSKKNMNPWNMWLISTASRIWSSRDEVGSTYSRTQGIAAACSATAVNSSLLCCSAADGRDGLHWQTEGTTYRRVQKYKDILYSMLMYKMSLYYGSEW